MLCFVFFINWSSRCCSVTASGRLYQFRLLWVNFGSCQYTIAWDFVNVSIRIFFILNVFVKELFEINREIFIFCRRKIYGVTRSRFPHHATWRAWKTRNYLLLSTGGNQRATVDLLTASRGDIRLQLDSLLRLKSIYHGSYSLLKIGSISITWKVCKKCLHLWAYFTKKISNYLNVYSLSGSWNDI